MGRQPYEGRGLPDGRELIAIAEADDRFKVRRRNGVAALNYAYVSDDPDQFTWPRGELRGLMVDEATGEILARPFQKFWSAAERGAAGTDWSERHIVLPKLDGSLVFPLRDGWATKGGPTSTSAKASALAAEAEPAVRALLARTRTDEDGSPCTPCFEYIGPDNRIVIGYARRRLVLLTVRRIADGQYWSYERMAAAHAEAQGESGPDERVGIVEPVDRLDGLDPGATDYRLRLCDRVAAWPGDEEGVVLAFEPSGHRVKIKSREYIALHRARDDYSRENRVLGVWADGNAAKLLEQLAPDRRKRLGDYYADIDHAVETLATEIAKSSTHIWKTAGGNRKSAAGAWLARNTETPCRRPLGFRAFDALEREQDPAEAVRSNTREVIARASGRAAHVETKVWPLLGPDGPRWRPPDGNLSDTDA